MLPHECSSTAGALREGDGDIHDTTLTAQPQSVGRRSRNGDEPSGTPLRTAVTRQPPVRAQSRPPSQPASRRSKLTAGRHPSGRERTSVFRGVLRPRDIRLSTTNPPEDGRLAHRPHGCPRAPASPQHEHAHGRHRNPLQDRRSLTRPPRPRHRARRPTEGPGGGVLLALASASASRGPLVRLMTLPAEAITVTISTTARSRQTTSPA